MNPWLAARDVLAVRLDNAGDVVMLGPALRAVKEASPEVRITLLASSGGALAAPLLPWVDEAVVWRAVWQDLGHLPFDPARERDLIDLLAGRRFDAALIFTSFSQTPHAPGYACYLAGIPLRAGESKEFGGTVLSSELRGAPDDLHQVERNLRLVEALGFPVRDRRLAVRIPPTARSAVPALLRRAGLDPGRPYLLLHPGASALARRYPADRFGAVARLLDERGWQVLVTGVEKEREAVATAGAAAPNAGCLVGEATLPEYAALIERAALTICGNTLPMHLADAVGTPVLVLYSGTDLESQWAPRSAPHRLLRVATPCHPCYLFDCPIGQPCLDLAPETVAAEAAALLAGAGGGNGRGGGSGGDRHGVRVEGGEPVIAGSGLRRPVARGWKPRAEPTEVPPGLRRVGEAWRSTPEGFLGISPGLETPGDGRAAVRWADQPGPLHELRARGHRRFRNPSPHRDGQEAAR